MEKLPGGLVSTSGRVPAELDSIEMVEIEDIVQLWKVYSTNPSVHEGDQGFRLQNFFWRIWGSGRPITGSKLSTLFLRISEPGSFTFEQVHKKPASPPPSNLKHDKPSSGSAGKTPLPPILKKSNTSHGESQKTARLLLIDPEGQSVTKKPSNPPTPIPTSHAEAVVGDSGGGRQSHKKTFVVANKAKNAKRRPVIMRRKSSQQSSVTSTQCSTRVTTPQSSVPSPPVVEEPPLLPSPPPPPPVAANTTTLTSNPTKQRQTRGTQAGEDLTVDDHNEEYPVPKLPPKELSEFLADVRGILCKDPSPPPFSPPPLSLKKAPAPIFYEKTTLRSFDIRHLSSQYYAKRTQPSTSSLVEKNFRGRFAEFKQQFEQPQGTVSSAGVPVTTTDRPTTTTSLSTTAELQNQIPSESSTRSTPSAGMTTDLAHYDNYSHGRTSTMATSIPISTHRSILSSTDSNPTNHPTTNDESGTNSGVFTQSPSFTLPRGPSQLSLLFEQDRGGQKGIPSQQINPQFIRRA